MRTSRTVESDGRRGVPGLHAFQAPGRDGSADRYGLHHTTSSQGARAAFEQATEAVLAHRPHAIDAIDRSLILEPHMVASLALAGFCYVILARPETVAMARLMYLRAICAAEINTTVTSDEQVLLQALDFAVRGRLRSSANILDEHITRAAAPLVMVKLSHALRFMVGDAGGMLRTTHHVLATSSSRRAGFGFVLGMHAFALEETGEYADALSVGMQAVQAERADSWGAHAVAHVFEMTGRPQMGINWLQRTADQWQGCNNFSGHMVWHMALFHLESGQHDRALMLYDQAIQPKGSEDFRDFANASSLLFRICQDGFDVGSRWVELAQMAQRRRRQGGLVFARLHDLLTLAVSGDTDACRDVLVAMEDMANEASGDQAHVAALVGVPMAKTIIAAMEHVGPRESVAGEPLDRLAGRLVKAGGSHAQRDLFVRVLAVEAGRRQDQDVLTRILELRRGLKRDDRFAARFANAVASR